MPVVRAVITVKGKVQKVGYRDNVQEIARERKVVGKVKNLEDGTVEITCEGEKRAIEDFKRGIKIKDSLIDVKSISATYEEPTGEFRYFKIEHGEVAQEIGESVGAGRRELIAVKEEIGGLRKDTHHGFTTVRKEIGGLRKDVGGLRKDVGGLRRDTTTGFSSVKNEVSKLRIDTNKNFSAMDTKYLKISLNIETLTKEIRNSNRNTQLLAKTFVKMVKALEKKRNK